MLIARLPDVEKPKNCDECDFLDKIYNCMLLHKNVHDDRLPFDSSISCDPECPIFEESDEEKTFEIVKILMKMKQRPGLYFPKGNRSEQLFAFLSGYGYGTNLYEKRLIWY